MTDTNDDETTPQCGEPTGSGDPCKRPPGWGVDGRETGPCVTHSDDDETSTGRPAHARSKLTRSRQESIASMLESGQSVAAACRCNDISRDTFYDWYQKGNEQEEGVYADFSDRIARARGHGEAELTDELIDMCKEKGDTKTMLAVLARRFPESWSDADEDGSDGGTVNIHLSPTDENAPEAEN